MIKTLELYYKGIIHTFETLAKGKLIYYFIPSIIMGVFFAYYYFQMAGARSGADSLSEIPLLGGVLSWTIGLFLDGIDAIVGFVFQFIVLVCFSPFNALLAEKYDNQITGNKFDGGFLRIINDVLRAMFIVFISILLDLVFMLGWWILTKIVPPLDAFTDIAYFIANAFFFGFSLFDYALERYNIGTFGTFGYGFKRFFTVTIGGTLFALLMMIPYIGIILAPGLVTMIVTYVYVHKENKVGLSRPIDETEQ